ncbi:branched-chain amino acid ABC transporter permease [Halovenus sp. WSH3]|uniref:Branched-chain amino acid ABC transporter permease n=1 Tax=Halovenus carboxidivorans TaxID=2692199 RepID=A0A6B0T4C5_9EURY|nr:branched-chain amino acid ABC transporter permease [Halovenus carboxidivorans]MXR50061.1 branched-chain amino acid ABC transporter permease [Halovenus carboxidivorans]
MSTRTEQDLSQLLRQFLLPATLVVVAGLLVVDLFRRLVTGAVGTATLATFLWDGVVFGMAIGLAGIGLAMTYSILKFANFAHGDYITFGAFAGWMVTFVVAGLGDFSLDLLVLVSGELSVADIGINVLATPLAIVLGLVVAAAATAALALVVDRIVFKPMRDADGISLLIASVGVALALRHVLLLVFQGSSRTLTTDVASVSVSVGDGAVAFGAHEVTLVVLAAVLMIGTHALLQYTKLGTAMRAMADNEDLARVTGIPTERVVRTAWLLGGALTGAAGFLIALESGTMNTSFGWELLLVIFSAVILGGIGSVYGAIAGGLIIGVASRLSLIWLPSELILAGAFGVMIVALLVKPQGLLGGVKTV